MTPHVALPHRDWAGVGGELRRIGLTNVAHALHVAAENSLSPQDVSALILFWERHKPAWGPGALYFRIRNGAPGVPPGEGWPPKSYAGSRSIPYAEPSTAKPLDAVSQREFLALPEHERREVLQDVLKANAFVRGLHSRNGPDSPAVIAACVARFRESKADAR